MRRIGALSLVVAALLSGRAMAAPALAPASYTVPPTGTILDYGGWRCVIGEVGNFAHSCSDGGRGARFFSRFVHIGAGSRDGYAATITGVECADPAGRAGISNRYPKEIPPLTLSPEARKTLTKLWPLETGRKAKFDLLDSSGRRHVSVALVVRGAEFLTWNGARRPVFRIDADYSVDCLGIGSSANNYDPRFKQTWWYDPKEALILKFRRHWPDHGLTTGYELKKAIYPESEIASVARMVPPARRAAASELPPAPYTVPPTGTILDYGDWRCTVGDVSGYAYFCSQGARRAQFFSRFVHIGTAPGDGYAGTLDEITCTDQGSRATSINVKRLPPLVVGGEGRAALKALWPLKIGRKAAFELTDSTGRRHISVSLAVSGTETLPWGGEKRAVFKIAAEYLVDCEYENRYGASYTPEFKQTWWYDPKESLILKFTRHWPDIAGNSGYALKNVTYPKSSAMAGAKAPMPPPVTPPRAVKKADDADQARQVRRDAFELAFWDSIRGSRNPEDFKAYLRQFPKGRFAELARIRIRSFSPEIALRNAKLEAQRKIIPPDPYADIRFGKYHALVIGNNDYRYITKLKTAVNDARVVAKVLERDYGFSVKLLLDAPRGSVLRAFSKLRAKLKFDDNHLIYYAGHGLLDDIGQEGYWLPVDAEEDVTTNWISTGAITVMLRAIRAKHVMVVADSCYSGTLVRAGPRAPRTAMERRACLKRMAKTRSRVALVSGGLEPVVDSGGDGNHSVFASAFIKALANNQGVLDGQALFNRIKRPVVLNADQTPRYADICRAGHDGGEFLLIRR